MGLLRRAIDGHNRVDLSYSDASDALTERVIRPLGLYFWGGVWTAGAWCELRQDFRNFRLDRIRGITVREDTFTLEPPVTLDSYREAMRARMAEADDA